MEDETDLPGCGHIWNPKRVEMICGVHLDPQILKAATACGQRCIPGTLWRWEQQFALLKIEKCTSGQINERWIHYQPDRDRPNPAFACTDQRNRCSHRNRTSSKMDAPNRQNIESSPGERSGTQRQDNGLVSDNRCETGFSCAPQQRKSPVGAGPTQGGYWLNLVACERPSRETGQ